MYTNPKMKIPYSLLEDILGTGPHNNPRTLSDGTTYYMLSDTDAIDETYNVSITDMGKIIAWAFEDADDSRFEDDLVELSKVMDHRSDSAENLNTLMNFLFDQVKQAKSLDPIQNNWLNWLDKVDALLKERPRI